MVGRPYPGIRWKIICVPGILMKYLSGLAPFPSHPLGLVLDLAALPLYHASGSCAYLLLPRS